MTNLGRMEKIPDLRDIWPREARDFSNWLAQDENLALLSETLGIDMVLEERESPVGDFNVDLYAIEENTGRKIIIENQLEDTNHDHLGKIITYASGKGAEIIVWIVKHAREEHQQAIAWLNQHTDEKIGFFLLEIELWKINDSLPAPKFNIVERPNEWAKVDPTDTTKMLQLQFWQAFSTYVENVQRDNKIFSLRKPRPQNWYDLRVGNGGVHIFLRISALKKYVGAGIYISNHKEIYENFAVNRETIENELGTPLTWSEGAKNCSILAKINADVQIIDNEANWKKYFIWLYEMAVKLKEIIQKYGEFAP